MYSKKGVKIKQIIIGFCLLIIPTLALATGTATSEPPTQTTFCQEIPTYPIPTTLSFCGYKLPLQERHCREMLDRELTISAFNRAQVVMWLKRAPRYFPLFTEQIKSLGLPDDLKFLAVAESSLIEGIHSHAGAAGLWQFMRHTGRRRGLRINSTIDERLDPIAATNCALNYLKFLKDKFNSWPLALAAYNCGERRVTDAVNEQKTDNYFALSLPTESERYFYRMAAIKLIFSNPAAYGYNLDIGECYKPLEVDYISLKLNHEYSLIDFSLRLDTTYHNLRKLNPHLINKRLPEGKFNLALPKGQRNRVADILETLPPLPKRRSHYYKVKKGDTLSAISRRFNTSIKHLSKLNRLKNSKIMVGQRLQLK